jgi:predicted ATPase/class 3 adenylate cyclase
VRRELPAGTVTFLFTDIEGSTRLLEQLGPEYEGALAEHRQLIREAVASHDGIEVDTQGDAFLCAFGRASDAIAAAADAQRWLAQTPMRVRMGIHTGEPTRTEEGYVGVDLHRGARLMAAAHGGQVLLSQATRDLLAHLPVRDLGEHRLKDLTHPQRLYQLLAEGLASDFPPPRTLENRPINLPTQPTALVGREKELEQLLGLLRRDDVRLLTLTGPGGTGKTRLALQAAAELLEEFADGVFFVNLAALTDPELVVPVVAQTLAVREQPGETLLETLAAHVAERRLLLLLDNFEQVAEAATALSVLLARAPELKLLATSRAPLHLSGEREYAVPPLAAQEAVSLFADRAQAVKASFSLNGNRPLVEEICRRLDCLPLAIELAAARIKLLSEQALLERLDARLKLLTGGARDLDERQRTLRAAIDWSYRLLTGEEQRLFARLSVFAGGRTLEAIDEICNSEGDLDVFEAVASLVDKSLLRQEEGPEQEPRFVMLETIHEYARERLVESGESEEVRGRHAEYFARLVERAEPSLRGGHEQSAWLGRLDAEQHNLRSAVEGSRVSGGAELAARIASASLAFWEVRGFLGESRRWLEDVLRLDLSEPARARALYAVGRLAGRQGDWQQMEMSARQAAELFRDLGERESCARALTLVGAASQQQGRYDEAEANYEEVLALAREVGDRPSESASLNNLATIKQEQREYDASIPMFEQSLALDRELDDVVGSTITLVNLGLATLGTGQVERAGACGCEALNLSVEVGHRWGIATAFDLLAKTAVAGKALDRAVRLFATSQMVLQAIGAELSAADKSEADDAIQNLRTELGDERFARTWAEGHALDMEAAVAYALQDAAPSERVASGRTAQEHR